jgi:hypothetical protein
MEREEKRRGGERGAQRERELAHSPDDSTHQVMLIHCIDKLAYT